MLIDSAIKEVKGRLTNQKGMLARCGRPTFPQSTRGDVYHVDKRGNNFPIENFIAPERGAGGAGG